MYYFCINIGACRFLAGSHTVFLLFVKGGHSYCSVWVKRRACKMMVNSTGVSGVYVNTLVTFGGAFFASLRWSTVPVSVVLLAWMIILLVLYCRLSVLSFR
jgi:hypothetical protein